MSTWCKVRAISRSQQLRIADQDCLPGVNYAFDIDLPRVRRDISRHSALGAIIVHGFTNALGTVVTSGGVVDEGTVNTDMVLRVTAGTLRLNGGGAVTLNAATPTVTAADATNPRIDNVVVTDSTGNVTIVAGTAAATPAPAAVAAGTTKLAEVAVAANTTAITNANITDWTVNRVVVGSVASINGAIN